MSNETPCPRYFEVKRWVDGTGKSQPDFDQAIWSRIGERGLSVRAIHALVRANVTTMAALAHMRPSDLLGIKDCGKRTAHELLEFRATSARGDSAPSDAYGAGFSAGWRMAMRFVKDKACTSPPVVIVPKNWSYDLPEVKP